MSLTITEMDHPRMLGEPAARAERLRQIRAPHVSALTNFVEELRTEAGADAAIPYFDPWDGGINAEILFLLEAPGPKAVNSSFISRNNPDETAKNFFELSNAAGLARTTTVVWNVVPWYIGTGRRIRAATPADLEAGLKPLPRLLRLLPRLRIVVLVGRKAARAAASVNHENPAIQIFQCPHPSPMFVNRAPGNRGKILEIFCAAATAPP